MKRFYFFTALISIVMLLAPSQLLAYQASGKIYSASGSTLSPVTGATGTISTGGSLNSITTSNSNNDWYGGWSQANLGGSQIRATAQKSTLGLYGSKTWYASSSNSDSGKDIVLKSGIAINPGLGLDLEAIAITQPGIPVMYQIALTNNTGSPIMINQFTADVVYDDSKIMLNGTIPPPDSFFDVFTEDFNFPDPVFKPKKKTKATSEFITPLEIPNGATTTLFQCEWIAAPFTASRDLTIIDVNVALNYDSMGAIPHQTEVILGSMDQMDPYLQIQQEPAWLANIDVNILPLTEPEFMEYIEQWQDPNFLQFPSLPYPDDPFIDPCLYVYPGDDSPGGDPNEPGLVMKWGDDSTPDGNYTSAWKYQYELDPDYSSCIIQITVIAPQFSPTPPNNQINLVSFGMQNIPQLGGPVRAWYWNCGPGTAIPWNTPVTITIDTTKTGVAAASPTATNYMNNPGFNLKNVQWLIVDENANWVGGAVNALPPGLPNNPGMWNYWQNLIVTPKAGGGTGQGAVNSKWHVKYSQPPVLLDANAIPPTINGWDEISDYNGLIMADDWKCEDNRPVTDIHWWGSFIGWNKPYLPPVVPQQFHIGIWTDVPANDPDNQLGYSHPGMLIWENYCDTFVWNYAGIDVDPRGINEDESCFQFAQFLSEDQWFHQEPMLDGQPNVYWLSIAPVWTTAQLNDPNFRHWGWKTRPHFYNDDACSITAVKDSTWPNESLNIFDLWQNGTELKGPFVNETDSWDLAFELTTNEPPAVQSADLDGSGLVDLTDFAIMADQWLTSGP